MTDPLRIPRRFADEIVQHCITGRPNEACGMVGLLDGEVVKVFRMTNAAGSPLRYSLEPREQLAVENTLAEKGWEGAPFHSHTRTEAYPSPTDVRLAVGDIPYLIVSVAQEPAQIKAFLIVKENWEDETGDIEEVPVEITG
ncbi:MAG: M67 family metallopeptidase [Actinobacteria bacterium]|nr:M67 family metallopeptidase [Actinomycetota bacterium]